MARAKKERIGMRMSDGMKKKYAELFINELDSMEKHNYTEPWVHPHSGRPCNLYRKSKPYKGVNAFFLTMLMQLKGWETPYFITKSQMKNEDGIYKYKGLTANATLALDDSGCAIIDEKGMPVMNVERRFPVFFFKPVFKDKDGNVIAPEDYDAMTEDEQQECKRYFYQTTYQVYNIGQTDFATRYPDDYKAMTQVPPHDYKAGERDATLEKMIMMGQWRCPIIFTGNESYYSPIEDVIHLPKRDKFLGDEMFYSTALHEMAHSTGPEVNRDTKSIFGTEKYAMEEFVAELSSACVCSMLGIGKLLNENTIAYVESWRKALKDPKSDFIPLVIDQVQRAVNYIMKQYDAVAGNKNTPLLLEAA